MTPRERLQAVYYGRRPDCVASLADLSYWRAGNGGGKFIPGKTNGANFGSVGQLLDLHRATGAAIHLNVGSFYNAHYDGGVVSESGIRGESYHHRFETPLGALEEIREWSDTTFSWPITHHMVQTVEDLKIIRYIAEHTQYSADWDLYAQADRLVGDLGLPVVGTPYTGMGFLMSRYAGVENTVLFAMDEPEEVVATVEAINASHRRVFRLMAEGPSEVLIVSDNLSSDVQSPPWFRKYSAAHYRWMAETAHAYGKPLATHIDGRLRGLLHAVDELGIDAADAVTPAPWGDLTPDECRTEAGDKLVLSGGIPPGDFHPRVSLEHFDRSVEAWLALADRSTALIVAPGDQLPPDGELSRVTRMVQMAESRRL
ncbi:MAG: uroporphyrinogen decarboxylase family protein [Opitutaceae bacterium]